MKPRKQYPSKKNIAVFDIESKDEDTQKEGFTRPYLLDFFDGINHFTFRNDVYLRGIDWKKRHFSRGGLIDKFLKWLFSKEEYKARKYSIYAHNGGKFDFLFLLGWLLKNGDLYRFSIVSVSGRIQRLDVWRKDESPLTDKYSFFDSFCIVPLSLDQFGKTFQLKIRKDTDVDLNLNEDDPIIEKYCKRDNETLFYGVTKLHKIINDLGGKVGITAPSTAINLFQSKYQRLWIANHKHFDNCEDNCKGCERILCDKKCHNCLHEWIRLGYYGGRTELFIKAGRNLNYYDVNSSYPYSMLQPMPVGDKYELENPTEKDLEEQYKKKRVGFVECTVEIPTECLIPPLPYRSKKLNKLIFPVGKFSGVWDYDELLLLKNPKVNGKILEIKKAVFYDTKAVFKEMIESLYQFRDKNSRKNYNDGIYNLGLDYIAKLLMNSLYGKFGMNPLRSAIILADPENDDFPLDGWPINGDFLSCKIWEREQIVDVDYINPVIAAHITALSRITLYLGMISVNGHIYYCDTDSIITDGFLPESTKLGGWKLEEPDVQLEFESEGPKWYRFKFHKKECQLIFCNGCKLVPVSKDRKGNIVYSTSKQRMKGVGSKAATYFAYDDMKKGGEVQWDRIMQHRTMLRSIVKDDVEGYFSPAIVRAKKTLKSKYNKRIMNDLGVSKPIVVIGAEHE